MPLTKLAASFDARRSKQYWQLLKRLYGGNDEAVEAIKASRDPGIYHGTSPVRAQNILEHGLTPGSFREFGTGSFFGDRHTASHYLADLPNGQDDPRGLLRLRLPSELKGSKTLYPDVQNAKVFAIEHPDALEEVAPRQVHYLKDYSPLFQRYGRLVEHRLDRMNGDELRDVGRLFSPDTAPNSDWSSPQAKQFLRRNLVERQANNYVRVNTPEEQDALQTYGKVHGKRLFEINIPETKRREMFFDHTTIPPYLLTDATP